VVFGQASRFTSVGADINLTPNAVRALDGIGLGDTLRETAAQPRFRICRMWDMGEETSRLGMAEEAEARHGAPQLTPHCAELKSALEAALPMHTVRLGHRATAILPDEHGVTLHFMRSDSESVDALIGADGVHSIARTSLFGLERPRFTGVVAFRAVVPSARPHGVPNLDRFTKLWGASPGSQIVAFPLNRGRDIFIFVTTAQKSWRHKSWT